MKVVVVIPDFISEPFAPLTCYYNKSCRWQTRAMQRLSAC